MHKSVVCPHYGRDEDACDVGCGYISSHDANMIIRYCSSDYCSCSKYRELNDRLQANGQDGAYGEPVVVPGRSVSQPPVLGLFSYGIAACIFAMAQLPLFDINLRLLCAVLFIAALSQVIAGISALKKNSFQGIAFCGIGLFWITMLAFDILPHAGYGFVPAPLTMVGYLVFWGLFSLIISQGVGDLTRVCRLVFSLFMAFLMLLATSYATGNPLLLKGAALVGIMSGLPGILVGLQHLYRESLKNCMPELTNTGKTR